MSFRHRLLSSWLLVLASCGPQRQPHQPVSNSAAPVLPAPSAPPAIENSAPAAEALKPAKPPSLPEPGSAIDPKSVEAAGQVVQHYGALIEQKRFAQAAKLWGDPAAAASFARELSQPQVHMEIGNLGATEGAAGSIYTTVPVVFTAGGSRRPANVVLRRVNDVPGSTQAQRRWHIERIEWEKAG